MSTPAPRRLTDHPSPNFSARDPDAPLRYIVLHYTGMESGEAALRRLCDPASEVSAHYLIGEDGAPLRLVPEDKRAWHVGQSFWQGVTDMNSASIGIELVNPGHAHGYRPFPAAQIETLIDMLNGIVQRHGFDPLRCLLAHSDIAPARKADPGELFPWQELAEAGYGIWPRPTAADAAPAGEAEAQRLLAKIGYDCADLPAAILAFQRRYCPAALTGAPERETLARLRALGRLLASKP